MPFWNPLSWFKQSGADKGRYLENDPISTGSIPATLPSHTHVDRANNQKAYLEKLALLQKFSQVISTRRELITSLRTIAETPTAQIIKNTYMNEGFYSNNNNEIVKVSYIPEDEREEIQGIIDTLFKDFQLNQLLVDNIPQLIQIGELLLTPKYEKDKGLVELLDNALLEDILPIYRGQKQVQFLKLTQDPTNPVQELDPDTYIHFMLPGEPIRVKVSIPENGIIKNYNLPETIKMGKSILYHAIDMLKKLDMLDAINLSLSLRGILMPSILSVGVPAGTIMKDLPEITEYYESHIEDIGMDVNQLETTNILDMLTMSATKVRVIPQFSDSKGALASVDLGKEKTPDFEQADKMLKQVALTTDTPINALSIDGEAIDRATLLKNYSKFTKRLAELQFAVKHGLAILICNHLYIGFGFKVAPEELAIDFKQIVNVELLEKLEFLVGSSASLKELYDTISAIAQDENSGMEMDTDVLLALVDSIFKDIPGAKGILRKRKKPVIAPIGDDPNVSTTGDGSSPDLGTEIAPEGTTGDVDAIDSTLADLSGLGGE